MKCFYLMSMVKRLLLVTGFWSGPFRVTEGLGRPHTLQQSTTVSPKAHTTSDSGTRNSGATGTSHSVKRCSSSPHTHFWFWLSWQWFIPVRTQAQGHGGAAATNSGVVYKDISSVFVGFLPSWMKFGLRSWKTDDVKDEGGSYMKTPACI